MAATFAVGTFRADGETFPGLVRDEQVLDLRTVADRLGLPAGFTVRELLARWADTLPVLTDLAADTSLDTLDLESLTVLPPVEPRQVLQSGANYFKHVVDLAVAHAEIAEGRTKEQVRAETEELMSRRVAEGTPYLFIGLPSAVTGAYDEVTLPAYSEKHDWELELAAVIGAPGFRLSRDEALDHVAGYTMVNDLTTRDLVFRRDMKEIGTDWFRGKNAPGFLPTGPFLVPAAFVGDTNALQLTLTLNGQVMQDESTSDMIFDVATLVAAASQITPLQPGDLILTGSPAGNGIAWGRLLRDGDVMESTITGLGVQRTVCRAESVAG